MMTAAVRIVRVLAGIRVWNADAMPPSGPVILVANHARRQLDGLVVAAASPRRLTFVVGADIRRTPVVRVARRLGAVIVTSEFAPLDVGFVRSCERVLENGGALLVFPEGRAMGGGAGTFQRGAAYLALRTCTALQPVRIDHERWGRTRVTFGRCFTPSREAINRRTLDSLTGLLQQSIHELREPRSRHEGPASCGT